jgi:protein involved in polysaccharide export with SLBB domain
MRHRPGRGPLPDETVGVDDVFEVKVVGEDRDVLGLPVAVDGTIDFPYVGRLKVLGLSPGRSSS